MSDATDIREAFRQQSIWCARLGSPFTALLMSVLADHLDDSTQTGRAILNWGETASALSDAVPLRLAGALHAAVRAERAPELADIYPPHPLPRAADLAEAVTGALRRLDGEFAEWLRYSPQTNETARSGVLFAGFMVIAQKTGLPLHLYELGASAGLNLIADRFSYRLGGVVVGAENSPVMLAPDWEGPPPPVSAVNVAARIGCDQAPLDVRNPSHCERLQAYIWPDQEARLERVKAAITLARQEKVQLDQTDAATWVDGKISVEPVEGVARVLFHSIAWQYFGAADQARITARMEEAGRNASAAAPLAWLSFEQATERGPRLQLRLWPGGEPHVLARADAHVRRVTWL